MVGVVNTGQLLEQKAGQRRVENGAGAKWKPSGKVPRFPFCFFWSAGPSTGRFETLRRIAGSGVLLSCALCRRKSGHLSFLPCSLLTEFLPFDVVDGVQPGLLN